MPIRCRSICASVTLLLPVALAHADDDPLPPLIPVPGYPPQSLGFPGTMPPNGIPPAYYRPPKTSDARGVPIGTNARVDEGAPNMPGAKPGSGPIYIGVEVMAPRAGVSVATNGALPGDLTGSIGGSPPTGPSGPDAQPPTVQPAPVVPAQPAPGLPPIPVPLPIPPSP